MFLLVKKLTVAATLSKLFKLFGGRATTPTETENLQLNRKNLENKKQLTGAVQSDWSWKDNDGDVILN